MVVDVLGRMFTAEELERDSVASESLQQVAAFARNGWPSKVPNGPLRAFYQVRHELSLWGKNQVCVARGQRAVIPESLRERVLDVAHRGRLQMSKVKLLCREAA